MSDGTDLTLIVVQLIALGMLAAMLFGAGWLAHEAWGDAYNRRGVPFGVKWRAIRRKQKRIDIRAAELIERGYDANLATEKARTELHEEAQQQTAALRKVGVE